MDWSFVTDTLTNPVVTGLLGLLIGAFCTHRLTERREGRKLLREKGEALITVFSQNNHRLTDWYFAICEQARQTTFLPRERPLIVLLDLDQVYTLQLLYFPSVNLQAFEDAHLALYHWLEQQWVQQCDDLDTWRAEFCQDEARPLLDAYGTASAEIMAQVALAIPYSRNLAAVLGRPFHHVARWYGDL